ncbi:MAG: gliding motility-associated C-terminal domain-containing protein [Saprospiraceae bacterium]
MISFSGILAGCKHKQAIPFLFLFWANFGFGQTYNDLSLKQSASPAIAAVGDTLTFFIQVFNEGQTNLTGLAIKAEIPASVSFLSYVAQPNTYFDPATKIWNIGNEMTANISSMSLEIKALAIEEGVVYQPAQIQSLNELDVDSDPGNDFLAEDDMEAACVSIPHQICTSQGESVTLTAADGFSGYEWYFDDGSGAVLVSTEQTFIASQPGSYTYSIIGGSCSQGLCCPIILEEFCSVSNQPPIAWVDDATTPLNSPVDIDILENDNDPNDGIDTASLTVVTSPANGTAVVNPDGTITYTPNTGFTGQDTFIYEICDYGLPMPVLCDTALVVITVGDFFFDLALEKTLAPNQSNLVDLGDEVAYILTVTNEGDFAATNITVTDHIPIGLALSPSSNGWSLDATGDAVFTITEVMKPGDVYEIEIILTVVYGASGQTILNVGEISAATDESGNVGIDIDSTPDNGDGAEDDQDEVAIQLEPHDPTGYIYCENTGELVMGGQISVVGPGEVYIISDGSTGYYEFFTDGTPGIYQIQYSLPIGYTFSQNCLPQAGPFDPTGLSDPVVLGLVPIGGALPNFTCNVNPYYLSFNLEPGDPFVFNNNIPLVCPDILVEDTVIVQANCNFGDPLFCFDVPYEELSNYAFNLNGEPYDAEFGPCDYLRERYYTMGALVALGDGDFQLDNWSVNGKTHSGEFQNVAELINMLNAWDPMGNWILDPLTHNLEGGLRQNYYSSIQVTNKGNGTIYELTLYQFYAPNSSYLILPPGDNDLVITRLDDGVIDSVHIRAFCVTPDFVEMTMPVGTTDTICFDLSELSGAVEAVFNPCLNGVDNAAEFVVLNDEICTEVYGIFPGEAEACFVICDDIGVCDTTYVLISVYDEDLQLVPDSLCTPKDVPIVGEVLLNDHINNDIISVEVIVPPNHGTVVVNSDNTITYFPDEGYCNDGEDEPLDLFTYEVCTPFECESTIVTVQVKCDGLIVYNGFSPNGDGVNDTFKIDGLHAYENHKLMVFNRWGNKVFQSENYQNDWDGFWDSKRLPCGTYFYLIELNNGETWLSGYLQIWW